MKRTKHILCLIFFFLTIFAALAEAQKIAIIESRRLYLYENAISFIKQDLRKFNKNTKFFVYNLEKKSSDKIIGDIKRKKVDLILTLGTKATKLAKQRIKDTPVVFSFVLNPVASGIIVDLESTGTNLTGVALDIPIEEQLSNFKLVVPYLRTVGVLYNPNETGIVIARARQIARRLGLNLRAIPIASPDEVPKKLKLLKGIDGLWMGADSVVFTPRNTEFILLYTIKQKLPFMGISEQFVKAGALCGKSLDFKRLYEQTAEQIKKILAGQNPADIPVQLPRKIKLAVNLKVAKMINLTIPQSTLRQAEVVFK